MYYIYIYIYIIIHILYIHVIYTYYTYILYILQIHRALYIYSNHLLLKPHLFTVQAFTQVLIHRLHFELSLFKRRFEGRVCVSQTVSLIKKYVLLFQ